MARKTLYIPETVEAVIDATEGESYSGRVSFLVLLSAELMTPPEPALTPAELRVVTQAVRDYVPAYDRGPEAVLRGAWHAVFDQAKSRIDTAALAKRLGALPLAAQAWIFEAARKGA